MRLFILYSLNLLLIFLFVFSPLLTKTSFAAELIQNGSFETTGSGWLSPWTFNAKTGAAGTISQVSSNKYDGSYSAQANITAASSTSPWLIQLSQSGVSLTSGATYTISFAAKASASRQIESLLQKTASPYTTYSNKVFNLTTSWQVFNYSFIPGTTDSATSLRFNLAQATGTIWIDKVSINNGTTQTGQAKGVSWRDPISAWGSNINGVNSDLNNMNAGKITWARVGLVYSTSPNPNFDALVNAAKNHNVNLLVTVHKNYPTKDLGDANQQATYKTWLASMVNRYKYYVKTWEITNEPNLPEEWNIDISPTSDQTTYQNSVNRYVTHLQNSYTTIKANDPTATVLYGGLSEWKVERYMDALLKTNAYLYFDNMSYHPYGNTPGYQSSDRRGMMDRYDALKYKMLSKPLWAGKPIWVTETGYNTSWSDKSGYVSSEQIKADYLAQSMKNLYQAGAKLPIFWYTLHENGGGNGFGLEVKNMSTLSTTFLTAFYKYRDLIF